MKTRTYPTIEQAVRAFVRRGKQQGYVIVLGGGWWEVTSVATPRRVQGFTELGKLLQRRGALTVHPDGTATFTEPASLTAEQLTALREYATLHGRTWKMQLLDDWMAARVPGPLQQLRNSRGPAWLNGFALD